MFKWIAEKRQCYMEMTTRDGDAFSLNTIREDLDLSSNKTYKELC